MNSVGGLLAAALMVFGALSHSVSAAEQTRPNIVLILCDDLGYADVGFNGAKDIVTPNLDELAAAGTICTSGYVAHPFCGPSRMGLMTGRYPHQFGAPFNLPNSGMGIEAYNRKGIDVDEVLISTMLQQSGYTTGAIGKWHMGIDAPYHPNNRGFDDFFGFLGGGHKYFPDQYLPIYDRQTRTGKSPINDYLIPMQHNGKQVREKEYLTDAFSREASRFVAEAGAKEQPFFLYVAYNAPHSPLEAKKEDLKKFSLIKDQKRKSYAAMVFAVDRGVGKIVDTLKQTGQFDDTLIIFLSDNGGKTSLGANNTPLRDGKGSAHEGGFRVPMFFHYPGVVPAGARYDHPITALDFYPTFVGLADAKMPPNKMLSGIDIWSDFLSGRSARTGETIYAVRHRDGFSDVAARRDNWKLCKTYNADWKLFNLDNDIGEDHDLSKQHPKRVKEMASEALNWCRDHTTPLWFDNEAAEQNWHQHKMPKYDVTFQVN